MRILTSPHSPSCSLRAGGLVVTGSNDKKIRLYAGLAEEPISVLEGHTVCRQITGGGFASRSSPVGFVARAPSFSAYAGRHGAPAIWWGPCVPLVRYACLVYGWGLCRSECSRTIRYADGAREGCSGGGLPAFSLCVCVQSRGGQSWLYRLGLVGPEGAGGRVPHSRACNDLHTHTHTHTHTHY